MQVISPSIELNAPGEVLKVVLTVPLLIDLSHGDAFQHRHNEFSLLLSLAGSLSSRVKDGSGEASRTKAYPAIEVVIRHFPSAFPLRGTP